MGIGLLTDTEKNTGRMVVVSDTPEAFRPALSKTAWKILTLLSIRECYPAEIARTLGIHHQAVYYHMKKLEKSSLVKRSIKKEVKGGRAITYKLAADGFAVVFGREKELPKRSKVNLPKFSSFFSEFIEKGFFDGWIVVGSPLPHGRNNTQARDGHYAVQLGFALGQYVPTPMRFPIKLDVDIKAERLEGSNLILVGGPKTNIISEEINNKLPVHFEPEGTWNKITDSSGKSYSYELDGIIAKVKNPWNKNKVCVILAGLTGAGTKASIVGITNSSERILSNYSSGQVSLIIRGLDLDGDGKVDSCDLIKYAEA